MLSRQEYERKYKEWCEEAVKMAQDMQNEGKLFDEIADASSDRALEMGLILQGFKVLKPEQVYGKTSTVPDWMRI